LDWPRQHVGTASGLNVLTDPIFSARASPLVFAGPARAHPPGVVIRDLPRIDVVVVSDNHYDHLNSASIDSLANQPGGPPLFLVPLGLRQWLAARGNMKPQHIDLDEAVQLHLDLGAKLSVGVHWGTFELANDPLNDPLPDRR
jgi:L-ascorbate metabolism protein UlaG (beta-lactamase superfamily)